MKKKDLDILNANFLKINIVFQLKTKNFIKIW